MAIEKIAETKAKSFEQLSSCFGRFIPEKLLQQNEKKPNPDLLQINRVLGFFLADDLC